MAGEQDPGSRHAPSALLPAAAGGAVASACPQERRPFLPAFPLRIARVRQLDADLLDDELFGLLKDELGDGLKLFKPRFRDLLEPELIALLCFAAHSLLVQSAASASYGCQLQNLTYRNERGSACVRPAIHSWFFPVCVFYYPGERRASHRERELSSEIVWRLPQHYHARHTSLSRTVRGDANRNPAPTTIQKRLHALLHVGVPWAWLRIMRASAVHGWVEQFEGDIRWKIWSALRKIENAYRAISLGNFLLFLYDGKYRTIIDRMLGIRLVYARRETGRRVSFEFLNRQLVWHAFTEFFFYLIPLINIRRARRILSRLLVSRTSERRRADFLAKLPVRVCAICYDRADDDADAGGTPSASAPLVDVHTPSRALPCGHVYCYFCLASEKMAEPKWQCLRCGEIVRGMQRVRGGEPESEEEENEKLDAEHQQKRHIVKSEGKA